MVDVLNNAGEVSGFTITSEMLAPITGAITGNAAVLLPVGITIMGIMVSISLIPRILYKFL